MPHWTAMINQSPKTTGRYIVCVRRLAPDDLGGNKTRITILRWLGNDWRIPTHFPDWINDEIEEYVTHWMYLPELPDEEGRE